MFLFPLLVFFKLLVFLEIFKFVCINILISSFLLWFLIELLILLLLDPLVLLWAVLMLLVSKTSTLFILHVIVLAIDDSSVVTNSSIASLLNRMTSQNGVLVNLSACNAHVDDVRVNFYTKTITYRRQLCKLFRITSSCFLEHFSFLSI